MWDDTWRRIYCACGTIKIGSPAHSRASTQVLFTVGFVETAMCCPWTTSNGCIGAILPLLGWFIPHAEWNVTETPYPNCALIRFGTYQFSCSFTVWASVISLLVPRLFFISSGKSVLSFLSEDGLFTNYDLWLLGLRIKGRVLHSKT